MKIARPVPRQLHIAVKRGRILINRGNTTVLPAYTVKLSLLKSRRAVLKHRSENTSRTKIKTRRRRTKRQGRRVSLRLTYQSIALSIFSYYVALVTFAMINLLRFFSSFDSSINGVILHGQRSLVHELISISCISKVGSSYFVKVASISLTGRQTFMTALLVRILMDFSLSRRE